MTCLTDWALTLTIQRAWRVAEALESGMVSFNTGPIAPGIARFDGVKFAGVGRKSSRDGIGDYLEQKTFSIGRL